MSPQDATPSPDRIDASRAIEPKTSVRSEPGAEFQSLMQGGKAAATGAAAQIPTPMEAARPPIASGAPSYPSLIAQANTMQDTLGDLQSQLKTPNLSLKRSQARLLRNKVGDAHNYINGAANKLGVETSPVKMPPSSGALERLMAYINDGQEKMVGIQSKLDELMGAGKELTPTDMMLVQIKMGQAQQELEYSSALLSKTVDAMKQLFNIQL